MTDYIKREDVEQIMYSYGIGGTMFVDDLLKPSESEEARQKEVWESVRNVLDRVAVKDVAPVRHGRWEEIDDLDFDTLYRCSVCGEEFYLIDGTPRENQYYYCPCCGSKMDEEVDERMRMTREEMAKEYRQKLTEQVKAVGQELIDRADDLVGNGGAISDFAIMLYFEQDSMPKIKLLREHLSMRCIDMEVQGGDD